MRTVLATFVITFAIVLIGAAVFVYSGVYDIGATAPHWSITHWVMETARLRSIKVHAEGITAPPGLDDPEKLLIGTEHFAAHCAVCHGAPGVPKGDIGRGLYPPPPDLARATQLYSRAELFWIVRNGIKMTGMPAWIDHSDEELWAIVAFINKLPGMSEQDYARLVMASMAHGGHHHGGTEEGRPEQTRPENHEHH